MGTAVRGVELATAMQTCMKTIVGSDAKSASEKVGELTFGVGGKAIVSVVVERVIGKFDKPEEPLVVAKKKSKKSKKAEGKAE